MRRALRLLPIPFSIALALPALAANEKPVSYALCPVEDAVPAFDGAPAAVVPQQQASQRAQSQLLPTDVFGDKQDGTNTTANYHGNVVMKRGDQFLNADNMFMNQEDGSYSAVGNVRYQDSGIRVVAKHASGNQNDDVHDAQILQYQLMARRGNGEADSLHMAGPVGQLLKTTYSTCSPQDPLWQRWYLSANQVKFNTDKGYATASHAVIHIGEVPVLYTPWIRFPIDDRRQTGLLFPSIGVSSQNGFDYLQPIYLNLAPNYDATLLPRYMSKRGAVLGAQFRYMYNGGIGELDGSWMPSDDLVRRRAYGYSLPGRTNTYNDPLQDKNRGFLRFRGSHNINSTWQARADYSWLSDERYLEDNGGMYNSYGSAYSVLTNTVGVYGRSEFWEAGVEAETYRLADYTLDRSSLPYDAAPRVYFKYEQPLQDWLKVGVNTEAAHFSQSGGSGGNRFDIKPYISFPMRGPAWFIEPGLAYRYTAYDLQKSLANQIALQLAQEKADEQGTPLPAVSSIRGDQHPSRSMPIVTLDAGLYFDRDTKWGNTPYLQTLEPRIYYLYAPYRNQNDLPLFDTRQMTFGWGQLFRDNQFSGADRQTDANQLTVALTSRSIRQSDGLEKFNISVGQILYFKNSDVVLNTYDPKTNVGDKPITQSRSDWVVDSNYMPTDRWTLGASYQYDPSKSRSDLTTFRSRYLVGGDGVINLSYRYRRDVLRQADLSFMFPINPVWSVIGRYYYSFQDKQALESIVGLQWDSCCLSVRLLGRHYVRNRIGDMDNEIALEFVLKGLGSTEQDTDRQLRRSILGYYRDDLYLVPPSVSAPTVGDSNDTGPDPF